MTRFNKSLRLSIFLLLSFSIYYSTPAAQAETITARATMPSLIAYTYQASGIFTVSPGVPNSVAVLYNPGVAQRFAKYPAWSPDGQSLAVTIDGPLFDDQLVIINRAGEVTKTLVQSLGVLQSTWSPDGTKIAYFCPTNSDGVSSFTMEICIVDVTTSVSQMVSSAGDDFTAAQNNGTLSWSKLQNVIIYSGEPDSSNAPGISSLDITTGVSTLLSGSDYVAYPSLSPDSSKIVYYGVSGTQGIIVANADLTSKTIIVPLDNTKQDNQQFGAPYPVWSPDGTQIAFVTPTDGATNQNGDIFVVSASGGAVTKTTASNLYEEDLSWGPGSDSGGTGTPTPVPPGSADCTIPGTPEKDTLTGTEEADVICGYAGNDKIDGKGGNDIIYGGDGNDNLIGGEGDDTIFGEGGNDKLTGGKGKDILRGGPGKDNLKAKDKIGKETVDGGAGKEDVCDADASDKKKGCP